MTADDLLAIARREKPDVRYARNRQGNAVAAWDHNLGRFVVVAGMTPEGSWHSLANELTIDGRPVFQDTDWGSDWIE